MKTLLCVLLCKKYPSSCTGTDIDWMQGCISFYRQDRYFNVAPELRCLQQTSQEVKFGPVLLCPPRVPVWISLRCMDASFFSAIPN